MSAASAPRGGRVDVPGTLAVLPRRELDDIVCRAAVRAGARMLAPVRFDAPLEADGARSSARACSTAKPRARSARAGCVLATGAVPQALIAAGMCERQHAQRRGAARLREERGDGRAHHSARGRLAPRLRPGYGWIFPCRDGVFNIGVGIADSHSRDRTASWHEGREPAPGVRRLHAQVYAPARELMAGGTLLGPTEGRAAALLARRRALLAPRPARHRRGRRQHLLVHRRGHRQGDGDRHPRRRGACSPAATRRDDAAVRADYEARLRALKPRFDALRARQPRQPPPLAGRPGDLARRRRARACCGA